VQLKTLQAQHRALLSRITENYSSPDDVPVALASEMEDLEHKLLKVAFEEHRQYFAEAATKYVGCALAEHYRIDYVAFSTHSAASQWSRTFQADTYRTALESKRNPFCPGCVIEVVPSVQPEEPLCMTENSTVIPDGDVRPRLHLGFEVQLKNGDFETVVGEAVSRYNDGKLLDVILDTGCTTEIHMLYSTVLVLRGYKTLMRGTKSMIIDNEDRYGIIIRVAFPNGPEVIDVHVNQRGTVVGIPGLAYFGDVFTVDVAKRRFDFVKRDGVF
jgi:hypothetical protein